MYIYIYVYIYIYIYIYDLYYMTDIRDTSINHYGFI